MRTSAAGSGGRGFSLIELLVVLAIMITATLAMAAAMPALRQDSAIEAAVSGLTSTFKKARMLAISNTTVTAVNVDPERRLYLIRGSGQAHPLPRGVTVRRPDGRVQGPIRFYPDGSADYARLLLSDGRRALAVTVSPLTGRVAVLK